MGKKIWQITVGVLLNVPTVLTVFFAVFVVLKNQQTPYDTSALLGWVIGLIALLASALFLEKITNLRAIEKNVRETNNFLKLQEGTPSLDSILKNRQQLKPLEERLKHTKEVMITGGSLFRLTSEYLGFFEEKAKEGCSFKFLLLNPNCTAAKLLALNIVYEVDSFDAYKKNINNSLIALHGLKEKYPDLIQIKTTDFIPSFSLFICDPEKIEGSIMVELYTCDVSTRNRPHMILLKNRESGWFRFFNNQFKVIWDNESNKEITRKHKAL